MAACISVFDEDGDYDPRNDFHECQLQDGHIAAGFAHKCHCGVTWICGIATTYEQTTT